MEIAIASGKGGTGKTLLSTNLAAFLSEDEPVLLLDLDVEEPNSGLFFNLDLVQEQDQYKSIPQWNPSVCSLCGTCQEVCAFHAVIQVKEQVMVLPDLCHSCYACSELCPDQALPMSSWKIGTLTHRTGKNLDLIESHLNIGEMQPVPLIAKTKQYASDHLPDDRIRVLDCPPGTSCPVIEATKEADWVILITEPTPFGFHDLKLAVQTMRKMGKPFGVVINRTGIGNADVFDYCRQERIPILTTWPDSRQIAEHYSRGELVYRIVPEIRQSLIGIKNYIYERQQAIQL